MKKRVQHITILLLLLLMSSCEPNWMNPFSGPGPEGYYPEGVPVTLILPFGSTEKYEIKVGTKAEASEIDESRIHDLYVMIFDQGDPDSEDDIHKRENPPRIYGRYFSYDHKVETLTELNNTSNECWYVENKAINDAEEKNTTGAVKISTVSCANAILVLIANVDNAVMNLDGEDPIDRLKEVRSLNELSGLTVELEQEVVNRKDLFLMTGKMAVNTTEMKWGTLPKNYDSNYQISLTPIDAKVKFRIKVNTDNIEKITPVYWQVCNTPNSCFLDENYSENGKNYPEDIRYFDTQTSYFEGTEVEGGETYYTFCFYMLENRQAPNNEDIISYYQRELQDKVDTGEEGYEKSSPPYGTNYVENTDWVFAPPRGTYVKFDMIITLKPAGLISYQDVDPSISINHALTSDAIFTVHLGNFSSSDTEERNSLNDYSTLRGQSYVYTITINNTSKIFAEVKNDVEDQPGQEGFLLLTDDEIVNADAHYEYHQLTFNYRPGMTQEKFSWYVKTPFGEGGPDLYLREDGKYDYEADGRTYNVGGVEKIGPQRDYKWVKFGVNTVLDSEETIDGETHPAGSYTAKRHKYPGDNHYDPEWEPGKEVRDVDDAGNPIECNDPNRDRPDLMDITQLIKFIFDETNKETEHISDPSKPISAFVPESSGNKVIRVTAFIDEYYYERNPLTGNVDKDLWREFVNAQPREMHILSDAKSSRDRKSDVILSSHSIIQQSIQTIYNIYSPGLRTLWGCEHVDEMRKKTNGWPYWPYSNTEGNGWESGKPGKAGEYSDVGKENGRLNSAYIWGLRSNNKFNGDDVTDQEWEDFLDYKVANKIPELKTDYQGMAWSCMTRNRDNNGNGVIDREEVRWYMASANQLVGMWVGTESLSISARLYQPSEGQWRAHIISSTDWRVCWSEEGGGATRYDWDYDGHAWSSVEDASAGESVRCIRNIGTFDDGETKDISFAPYNWTIDSYFTLDAHPDGSYTFLFDRLNPKSIRELTEKELPYHDQFSFSNRVYKKMITQSPSQDISYSVNLSEINTRVSQKGYNEFCPPGYRFPNQSEMALMSLYLPNSFFDMPGGAYMPSRTFYDRGYFGLPGKKDDPLMTPAEKLNENVKVGWGYSTNDHKPHCAPYNATMNHSRCVKDEDMTGTIEGDLELGTEVLHPGDKWKVFFNFASMGSSIIDAKLKLCYTTHSGTYREDEVLITKAPSGLEYRTHQEVRIPTLAELGLEAFDLQTEKKNMKFKIEMRNAAGTDTTFHTDFVLASHYGGTIDILPDFDPNNGFKIRINAESSSSAFPIKTVKLRWRQENGAYTEQNVTVADQTRSSGTFDCYWHPAWLDNNTVVADNTKYYFSAIVGGDTDEGVVGRNINLDDAEMEFLKINYNPNPAPQGGWTYSNRGQATNRWYPQAIANLNFDQGDFIDAFLDVTNCVYIPKQEGTVDGNNDLGMDNLIAIGPETHPIQQEPNNNGVEWKPNNVLFYYPAHVIKNGNGVDNLQIAVLSSNTTSRIQPFDINSGKLRLLLKKDNGRGWLLINNFTGNEDSEPDWTADIGKNGHPTQQEIPTYAANAQSRIDNLVSKTTLYVASTEGNHRSRALYKYVRVVRKHSY